MADAPQPAGPASERRQGQLSRDSVLARGLAGIASVTLATFGLGAAAALIAFVVAQLL